MSICISLLLLRGIQRANDAAKEDPGKSMRILYRGAVQRFVLVLALIAMGIALLKLSPLAVVTGFALAQIGYLLGSKYKV